MRETKRSEQLFKEAKNYFPGGVNSPVRAFGSVEGDPLFIARGEGSRIWDVDGNSYLDFCGSWGPLILGHRHPAVMEAVTEALGKGTSFGAPTEAENELAKLILSNNGFPGKIRFVSSGTEAVMSAIRLARGATGRDLIVKFEGCYHGHADALLVKAGSGLATSGISSSAGVTAATARETIVVPLNDRDAVEKAFEEHPGRIAALIIEPVPANNGLLIQEEGFLGFLRSITSTQGSLLIFDEVITGFRLGFAGAAGRYDIRPDLVTYGKIIGGGFPVGAYGGSADLMSHIAPEGKVYQAGTLSGNPVAMAAGRAQLEQCLAKNFYESLERRTERLASAIGAHAEAKGYGLKVFTAGSIFWPAFTGRDAIRAAGDIEADGIRIFARLHRELLNNGIYLGPSGYEVCFVSAAHTEADIDEAAKLINRSLDTILG